jgi:hypothetical protein
MAAKPGASGIRLVGRLARPLTFACPLLFRPRLRVRITCCCHLYYRMHTLLMPLRMLPAGETAAMPDLGVQR